MPRRRIRLDKRTHRPVLSDVLPFEVPTTFSNRHYYKFLTEHEVEVSSDRISWTAGDAALDELFRLLLGVKTSKPIQSGNVEQWGRKKSIKFVLKNHCQLDTIPFRFRVSHKSGDARTLSIIHPRSQLIVSSFYKHYAPSIIYYCSVSEYSIRHPVSVSHIAFYRDKTHQFRLDQTDKGVEETELEYEQMSSYFVYRRYSNIHRFFESYQYHRAEKKYDAMLQVDLSKCFDSIYTHSIVWAILGKSQAKFKLDLSKATFGGQFDRMMQLLNQRETNGIVIGPEFSRIFAEIILQAVDRSVETQLQNKSNLQHKVDYEVFRYVDDYFVFYNQASTALRFMEVLRTELLEYKLHINSAKSKTYEKPIITEITIAKDRISLLLNEEIKRSFPDADISESGDPLSAPSQSPSSVNPSRLIIKYKTILKETKVIYGDVLNYTFAVVEKKAFQLMGDFSSSKPSDDRQKAVARSIRGLLEFVFFIYAASPRVNHTVRLVRLVANCVDFLNEQQFGFELKHMVFKYIHDNIAHQLNKNRMDRFREVETLYLLNALAHLGREYWLPESTLASYLDLKTEGQDFVRDEFLNHFSITVALSYIKNKLIYTKVRRFLEGHAIGKLTHMRAHCPNDAENLMLFLDLIVCPYVSQGTKDALGAIYGFQPAALASLQGVSSEWFTTWHSFDLSKELDAKRSREVY